MPAEPTSVSPIELTRGAFASANYADFDAMMSFFGPDSVWDVTRWGLGTHSGPVAIRRFLEGWIGSLEDYHVVVEEIADFGGGVVFAVATQHGQSAGGGRLRLRYAPVFEWTDGVAVRVTHYRDIEQGRAAAELAARARR